jgi:hypothetical protein
MSNFMKIRPVGTELYHGDGRTERQTDMTTLSLFAILRMRLKWIPETDCRKFAEALAKGLLVWLLYPPASPSVCDSLLAPKYIFQTPLNAV